MMKRVVIACLGLLGSLAAVCAQGLDQPHVPDLKELGQDAMPPVAPGVFHGNYCGIGDKGPSLPPVDALDRACMNHDACTPSGGLPSCACNARFRQETHAVATGPSQPDDLRALAALVEASIPVIPCRR